MKKILPLIVCSLLTSGAWAQTALPYNTGFDNAAGTAGWQEFRKGYNSSYHWGAGSSAALCLTPPSGPNCVGHDYTMGGTATSPTVDWYVSPPFNFSGGAIVNSVQVRVYSFMGTADADDHFGMYLLQGSPDPAVATVTQLANFTTMVSATAPWTTMTNYTIPAKTGTCYIAFKYTTLTNWFTASVDELKISGLGGSSCNSPSGITFSNITSSGVKLTWPAVTGATGYEYAVNTTQAHPTGAGTPSSALTQTVGGLSSGTKYYAHVRAKCGTNASPWTTVTFNTPFPTSVSYVNGNPDINVYPNPVNDVLKISGLTTDMAVRLFDITGRLLVQQTATASNIEIPAELLPAGVLIVSISNEQFSYKTRLIKE